MLLQSKPRAPLRGFYAVLLASDLITMHLYDSDL